MCDRKIAMDVQRPRDTRQFNSGSVGAEPGSSPPQRDHANDERSALSRDRSSLGWFRESFSVGSLLTHVPRSARLLHVLRGFVMSITHTEGAFGSAPAFVIEPESDEFTSAVAMKITATEVRRRMSSGERVAFVDARTVDECIESPIRIERSLRMSHSEVVERFKGLPRGRMIVTYCNCLAEESSTRVALDLMRLGLSDVHPLIGGLDAWRAVGGPVEFV